jgi:hypothetical protein
MTTLMQFKSSVNFSPGNNNISVLSGKGLFDTATFAYNDHARGTASHCVIVEGTGSTSGIQFTCSDYGVSIEPAVEK